MFIKEDEEKKEPVAEVSEVAEEAVSEVAPTIKFNYQATESETHVGEGVYSEDISSQLMAGLEESSRAFTVCI